MLSSMLDASGIDNGSEKSFSFTTYNTKARKNLLNSNNYSYQNHLEKLNQTLKNRKKG